MSRDQLMAKEFMGDVNICDGDDLIRGTLAIKLTPSLSTGDLKPSIKSSQHICS